MADMSRLLTPRSVAIVGASPTPGSLGNSVLQNLKRHRFDGTIHLINPRRDEIDGQKCLKSIDELPEAVDVAVLTIPGPAVLPAVRSLAARGVGAAIIFSAGFAEGGEDGLAAQAEIARIANVHGMVIEGPNCLGMVNYSAGIPLTFVETPVLDLTDKPAVGIVSQSGAMAVVLGTTLMSKELGITLSVSTGNEAASGVEDYIDYCLNDPVTHAIGMIVEQFRDPPRFLALAEQARMAGKPIVLLHPGTSDAARESAATHTGAMAGNWHVMKVKVERAGVVLVDSLEALADVLDLAVRTAPVRKGGVAVLTESGAFKALAFDFAESIDLELPVMTGSTAEKMRAAVPDFIPVSNPMDLTAQALVDPDLYRRAVEPLLDDDQFSALVFGIIQTDEATSARKFPAIIEAIKTLKPQKPVIFAGLDDGADVPRGYITELRKNGISYFPSPNRALSALRHLGRWAERDFTPATETGIELKLPAGVLPEYRAKEVLSAIDVPVPAGGFATTLEDARQIAAKIGYPVAMKAQASALSHKSDAGGVILNLRSDAELEEAWGRLNKNVAAYNAAITLDGVLVEAMGQPGAELIVGARNDPAWGAVILVGFGGITAELLKDIRLLPADLTHDAIKAELRLLRQGALLDGYRGSPALDIDAVAGLITTLGRVLIGTPTIREIDLNPVVVYPEGQGIVALDALILTESQS